MSICTLTVPSAGSLPWRKQGSYGQGNAKYHDIGAKMTTIHPTLAYPYNRNFPTQNRLWPAPLVPVGW